MSAIHGVEGLIKWIKGDEWRNDCQAPFRAEKSDLTKSIAYYWP